MEDCYKDLMWAVLTLIRRMDNRLDQIMTAQQDIDAAVTVIQEVAKDIQGEVVKLIADLKVKGVDTSVLTAALPGLQAAQSALDNAVPEPSSTSTSTSTSSGTSSSTGTSTSTSTSTSSA